MSTSIRATACFRPLWQPTFARSFFSTSATRRAAEEWPQQFPRGPFYDAIMNKPLQHAPDGKPEEPPLSADPSVLPEGKKPVDVESSPAPTKKKPGRPAKSSDASSASGSSSSASHSHPTCSTLSQSVSTSSTNKTQDKARISFGSSLQGPANQAERDETKEKKLAESTLIAGVLVPPKPEEPDNCCMSGCVNCVWERYQEELEEWSAKKKEALAAQVAEEKNESTRSDTGADRRPRQAAITAAAKSEEAQISESTVAEDVWQEDAMKDIPVGIREFMKQEKRLKEKQNERRTPAGG